MKDLTQPNEAQAKWERLASKLAESQPWPGSYTFKFIVPTAECDNLTQELKEFADKLTRRESSGGKYVAMTLQAEFADPEAVISIYKQVAGIKGILTL